MSFLMDIIKEKNEVDAHKGKGNDTMNTKFYTFRQNNVKGIWQQTQNIDKFVTIEASDFNEAKNIFLAIIDNDAKIAKANKQYFPMFCECCGSRWTIDENYVDITLNINYFLSGGSNHVMHFLGQ